MLSSSVLTWVDSSWKGTKMIVCSSPEFFTIYFSLFFFFVLGFFSFVKDF